MKSCLSLFMLFLLTMLGACNQETTENIHSEDQEGVDSTLPDLEIQNFWSGFTVTTDGSTDEVSPQNTIVFLEEEHWNSFADKYFPSAKSDTTIEGPIDFSTYALVYTGSHSAKPFRASSLSIIGYKIEENSLVSIYDEEAKGVRAVTEVEGTEVWFLNFDLVQKADLPDDLNNVYQP